MAFEPIPIDFAEEDLDRIVFGGDGLVPVVVQAVGDGMVLMLAYMNRESLRRTLSSGRTCFWSRSRQEYWVKGETSGDRQWVRDVRYDCDGDALLVTVEQEGRGACHTGERSCFYRAIGRPFVSAGRGEGSDVGGEEGSGGSVGKAPGGVLVEMPGDGGGGANAVGQVVAGWSDASP